MPKTTFAKLAKGNAMLKMPFFSFFLFLQGYTPTNESTPLYSTVKDPKKSRDGDLHIFCHPFAEEREREVFPRRKGNLLYPPAQLASLPIAKRSDFRKVGR